MCSLPHTIEAVVLAVVASVKNLLKKVLNLSFNISLKNVGYERIALLKDSCEWGEWNEMGGSS